MAPEDHLAHFQDLQQSVPSFDRSSRSQKVSIPKSDCTDKRSTNRRHTMIPGSRLTRSPNGIDQQVRDPEEIGRRSVDLKSVDPQEASIPGKRRSEDPKEIERRLKRSVTQSNIRRKRSEFSNCRAITERLWSVRP
jgi:hypothetical protein